MVKPADAAGPPAVPPPKPRPPRFRTALPLAVLTAGLLLLAAVIVAGGLAAQAAHAVRSVIGSPSPTLTARRRRT